MTKGVYNSYESWKRGLRNYRDTISFVQFKIEGDKDIAQAYYLKDVKAADNYTNRSFIGEWDGTQGTIGGETIVKSTKKDE